MIKFTAKADDRTIIGIGLSHTNLTRLRDCSPIQFRGEDIGLNGYEILIFAGKTEETMAAELSPLITAKTVITDKSHG